MISWVLVKQQKTNTFQQCKWASTTKKNGLNLLLREVYINLFCWLYQPVLLVSVFVHIWHVHHYLGVHPSYQWKMRCWPSQCWPRPLWFVLITFCQIDQCHSIHSGGWFTKWYESNIEYTIPKLNFQVDFQDESPSILAALGFLTKKYPQSASVPWGFSWGNTDQGATERTLACLEDWEIGEVVQKRCPHVDWFVPAISGHIFIYIYIYVVIYIYIYVCSCSNLFQPWRIDEHRKIHENSPRYFLCDLKPPNTVGIRNPGPFWFNHEVLQIPMTVTWTNNLKCPNCLSGLGQLWAVFCGFL